VCLADFGMPWHSSKLCAHSGKTRKNYNFLILHGVMFFLYGPSIRIFSKKLTSMDMIIVIVYNISPTHIIFNKCLISKKICLKIVFPKINLVVEFLISNVFMIFIIIYISYWNFQILIINNYDGFQQLNFLFSIQGKEKENVFRETWSHPSWNKMEIN
jgi:hypothetical protein